MQISVALDGARRRDIHLAQGDDVTLTVVVYAHDGDTVPIAVTDQAFITASGAPGFAYGTPFAVSSDSVGRNWFRLVGDIAGVTTTLAWGWIFVEGEEGVTTYRPLDGYWVSP